MTSNGHCPHRTKFLPYSTTATALCAALIAFGCAVPATSMHVICKRVSPVALDQCDKQHSDFSQLGHEQQLRRQAGWRLHGGHGRMHG